MPTCVYCNFTTRKNGNYNAHLLTSKHIGRTFVKMRKQQQHIALPNVEKNIYKNKGYYGQGAYVPHSLQLLTSRCAMVASLPEKFEII